MPGFWSKKPTAKEQARSAQKETRSVVRSNQRQMDREIRDLERQEKQLLLEIKRRARAPGVNPANDPALRAQAKQLVQIRKQREKCFETKAHLSAVGMQASSMASQVAAVSAVGSVTEALGAANGVMDARQMTQTMAEFTRQNEAAKLKEELMDDALADAFDDEEVQEEADLVTSQVLAELGVELDQKMVGLDAPSQTLPQKQATPATEEEEALMDALPDLRARLDAL